MPILVGNSRKSTRMDARKLLTLIYMYMGKKEESFSQCTFGYFVAKDSQKNFLTMDSQLQEVAYAREAHMQLNWKCKKDECMIVGIRAIVMVAEFLPSKGCSVILKTDP